MLHENRFRVKFSKYTQCFTLQPLPSPLPSPKPPKAKNLRGLLPVLKAIYWPDYEYDADKNKYKITTGAGSVRGGTNRGKIVHRQIRDFTNKSPSYFTKVHGEEIHEYTEHLIKSKTVWKTTHAVAEFPIFDEELGIGTAIDDLSYKIQDGHVFVIIADWKVGFDSYFKQFNGHMKGVLAELDNSPCSQALIQVLFNYIFLKKTYGFTADALVAVQICKAGTHTERVPQVLIDNADIVYADFKKRVQEMDALAKEEKQKKKLAKAKSKQKQKSKSK